MDEWDRDEAGGGGSSTDRIMPFEFLYLLCNARPRLEELATLMPPKIGIKKERLSDFYDGDERRPDLEQIWPFDYKNNSVRHNPHER